MSNLEPCINRCGNLVTHRSGVCQWCRMVNCKKCGTLFFPKEVNKEKCGKCNLKEKKVEYVSISDCHILFDVEV